jgi:hypothetical protein
MFEVISIIWHDGDCPGSISKPLATVSLDAMPTWRIPGENKMTNAEKITTNANVTDGSKLASKSEAIQVPDGKRSAADERRFQDALEDDEVREALRALHGAGSTPRGRIRP